MMQQDFIHREGRGWIRKVHPLPGLNISPSRFCTSVFFSNSVTAVILKDLQWVPPKVVGQIITKYVTVLIESHLFLTVS